MDNSKTIVTGDMGGNFEPLITYAQNEGKCLTKKDIVIVLGDFGVFKSTIEEIKGLNERLPFTLMFLDGNHEDFVLLDSFDIKEMYGGKVRDINGVYHLMRGQVYTLPNGKVIATLGGGDSRDKENRIEGVNWFKEEVITENDQEELMNNLEKHGYKVDAFLTHSPSATPKISLHNEMVRCGIGNIFNPTYCDYIIRDSLKKIEAGAHYCGHEHIDLERIENNNRHLFVHRNFVEI